MSCPFQPAAPAQNVSSVALPTTSDDASEVPDGEPIPHPPESWFTGNLREIDLSFPASSFWRLADIYGPIYSLNMVSRKTVVVSSYELINEVCDDTFYEKKVSGVQERIRIFSKNGLFTAYNDEEEWGIAHRTLVPAFGPIHVRTMFPKMVDVISQMILRWDRFGPEHRISCIEDFTRLAFDVIGLCAFNYRFNAFYGEKLPEFADHLVDLLIEVGKRSNRLELENWLRFRSRQKLEDDIHTLWGVCDKIVAERKANPQPDVDDLLNVMLTAKDPVTGKGFTDENIRYQMVTFLVAGHDTSAGTMNFLLYNLLRHPEKLQKCYAEVDAVAGDRQIELADLPKLQFIEASIRETLRYLGPIPAISRAAKKPRLLGGKYKVAPDATILLNLKGLHHDPAVWGSDADEFKPERFLDGAWERMPPNAWKPFGNGVRQCIGRYLAEQEIIIAIAMVLQRFIVEQADPDYELKIKSTLTMKPDQFYIRVRRRPGKDHLFDFTGSAAAPTARLGAGRPKTPAAVPPPPSDLKPLALFYGGNTGTCKSFGEDLQTEASRFGFHADAVRGLDEAVENLPKDRPVVIVTSSYEGLPPDNARNFVAWLEARAAGGTGGDLLRGVSYAVFGLGNRDWAATFHRIPRLVDRLLAELGAMRIVPAGYVDVGQDISGPFEDWKAGLFPGLRELAGVAGKVTLEEIKAEISHPETPSKLAGEEVSEGLVLVNSVLVKEGLVGPEKRHLEVLLPPGVEYRSGDYLVVQPFNPSNNVSRVLKRFGLHLDDLVTITGTSKEHLKGRDSGVISVYELLYTRVELASPASQRQAALLAKLAQAGDAARLAVLASDKHYEEQILGKRASVMDLLEDFPSISLPFGEFLGMLAPLAPRQYSISSSPMAKHAVPASSTAFSTKLGGSGDDDGDGDGDGVDKASLTASVTYDVFSAPSYSNPSRPFRGVSSTYLASLLPGSRLRCFVRSTAAPFRLPLDLRTPVIFIAAGTGVAPMRAFIQDRAAMAAARPGGAEANLGPAVLYFGFRDFDEDYLYREELDQAARDGIVSVRIAASRHAGPGGHVGHVDEAIWEDREELRQLFREGAKILVCGSAARLGRSTQEVCLKIYGEANPGATREEAETWLLKQKEDRYVSDVFG